MARTLSLYVARRFTATILSGFAIIFALIYTVDLVEMLRRTGDAPGANGVMLAYLSFLHTPIIAEQALPFAVLFGAMAAFLNLSRRLELIVARAAGVSAWQFLTPPILVVALVGLVSIMLYNPMATAMKARSDSLEAKLFGGAGASNSEIWLRQKSVDGQAVLHANAHDGAHLSGVEIYSFDAQGAFSERIDAVSAELNEGYWRLNDAHLIVPGAAPESHALYDLATSLTPEELSQAFVSPDIVSFWRLPGLATQTERAGLNPTAYRLRYQELLARPLLLAAMVFIAACVSLRFFRMGGVEATVAGGVFAGFVLYVGTKLVSELGGAGFLSAPIAGWSPAVLGCLFGVYVLSHLEDG